MGPCWRHWARSYAVTRDAPASGRWAREEAERPERHESPLRRGGNGARAIQRRPKSSSECSKRGGVARVQGPRHFREGSKASATFHCEGSKASATFPTFLLLRRGALGGPGRRREDRRAEGKRFESCATCAWCAWCLGDVAGPMGGVSGCAGGQRWGRQTARRRRRRRWP